MLRVMETDLVWNPVLPSPWATLNHFLDLDEPQSPSVQNGDSGDKAIEALAALRRSRGFIPTLSPTSLAKQESFYLTNEEGCESLVGHQTRYMFNKY